MINVRPSQSSLSLLPTPSIALFPPKWIPISHSSLQNSFHVLFNRYPVLGESGWASFVSEWLIREGVFVPEDLFCFAYCSMPFNLIHTQPTQGDFTLQLQIYHHVGRAACLKNLRKFSGKTSRSHLFTSVRVDETDRPHVGDDIAGGGDPLFRNPWAWTESLLETQYAPLKMMKSIWLFWMLLVRYSRNLMRMRFHFLLNCAIFGKLA